MSPDWYSNYDMHGMPSGDDDRALIDALAFCGHEMNNTITRVLLSLETLTLDGDAHFTDRQKRAVQSLDENIHRLRKISQTYMNMARLEESSMMPDLETVEPIGEIIEPLVRSYAELLQDRQQVCHLRAYTAGLHVFAERTLLTSIFDNLLSNAIKYGKPGAQIDISITEQQSWLVISVSNSVDRLDQSMLDNAFDRFARGSNAQNQSGSGIGLYLVKWIVERLGGTISIETSETRHQVTFVVHLPVYSD
jgi:signal transduction histidine kinase